MILTLAEQLVDGYFAVIPRCKPQPSNADKALLIAHRGAHDNARGIFENTIEAFSLAQEAGCWGIEFDVHFTADHIPVVNHDPTLLRLWGHDVSIASLSFKELRALEPRIPHLLEVVERYGQHMHLFIELKVEVQQQGALALCLENLLPGTNYHLLSLDEGIFETLHFFPRQCLLLVAVHNNVKTFCELSIKNGYGGVLGSYLLITNRCINQLKNANQACGVGFVDSKFSLYRELNRGICWIFSNQVIKVSACLKQLKSESL